MKNKLLRAIPNFLLIVLGLGLTSCGGTFTLRPDGTIGYTAPEILKAPIVHEAK